MKASNWLLSLFLILNPTTALWGKPVIRDGIEWLQPADFLNVIGTDIVNSCPPPDGKCVGVLSGVDITGYTWASIGEIAALLNSYGVEPALSTISPDYVAITGSEWAPAIFEDFLLTENAPNGSALFGITRTVESDSPIPIAPGTFHYIGSIGDDAQPDGADFVSTAESFFLNQSRPFQGAWFWRKESSPKEFIPLPDLSPVGIILLLFGLMLIARRQTSGA